MNFILDFFRTVAFRPIVTLLAGIINGLQFLHIPGSLGLAIIILTILIRILVWPFMSSQLKVSKKMQELKPRMDELKKEHGSNKQSLAAAQAALYKEHGINPAGGCLPSIIQIIILISLYQAILLLFNTNTPLSQINQLIYIPSLHLASKPDPVFMGLNLASRPSNFGQIGYLILLLPVLTALLQFIQSTMMTPKTVKKYASDSPTEKKEKEGTEDAMMAVQSQMRFMMPLMIGYFSFSFPIGLSIYWNTLTVIGIIQQYFISGWGGMEGLLNRFKR